MPINHRAIVRLSVFLFSSVLLALVLPLHSLAQVPTQAAPPPAPVLVHGKTLFSVGPVLSFPAQARAEAISKRIEDLSSDVRMRSVPITVADAENSSNIMAGDLVVMSVTNQDARAAGTSRQLLAQNYAGRISSALSAFHYQYSFKSLVLGGVYSVVSTVLLILLLKFLGIAFRRIYRKFDAWRGTVIRSLRIQRFELLPGDRITDFAIGIVKFLRVAIVLVVLYAYASLVLGFFPWTRGYARILLEYVLAPLKTVGVSIAVFLPNAFFIAVVLFITYYVIKLIRTIFVQIAKGTIVFPGFYPEWADPTYKIVRIMILVLATVVVFPYLPGSDSPAFKGVSIFLGVLFSLGSTSAIANVVSGVILTYMRAFKVGDRVKIADTVGDVIEKTLLITRIRSIKNVEITIANAMVLNSHIINFSSSALQEGLILHTSVTIGYDAPWRTVHQLLIEAAQSCEGILKEPKPFVLQTALDDFYVHYEINAYTDQPNRMAAMYSHLHQRIQDKFNEAGVEIMSSHYSNVRDGNQTTIPEDYLPKDYTAPHFELGLEKLIGKTDFGRTSPQRGETGRSVSEEK